MDIDNSDPFPDDEDDDDEVMVVLDNGESIPYEEWAARQAIMDGLRSMLDDLESEEASELFEGDEEDEDDGFEDEDE